MSGLFLHGVKSSLIPDDLCCPCTSSEMGPSFQVMVMESWTSEKKSECVWECDWLIKKMPSRKNMNLNCDIFLTQGFFLLFQAGLVEVQLDTGAAQVQWDNHAWSRCKATASNTAGFLNENKSLMMV